MSKVFRYADTHFSENTTSITLHQVDTHFQKKCDTPSNKIVGAVITVDPCQIVFRYAETHSFENNISLKLHHVDTPSGEVG